MAKTTERKKSRTNKEATGAQGRKDMFLMDPDDLVVVTDPSDPLFDPKTKLPVPKWMIDSILKRGIKQAIGMTQRDDGKWYVVFGRTRVRAAQEAKKIRAKQRGLPPIRVPATKERGSNAEHFGTMVAENAQRVGYTFEQKAEIVKRYLAMGGTEEDCAEALVISVHAVKDIVSVMDGPSAVRKALEGGDVVLSEAVRLAKLPASEATKKLAEVKAIRKNAKGKKDGSGAKARAVATGGVVRPSVKEIQSKLVEVESAKGMGPIERRSIVRALAWVLGSAKDDPADVVGADVDASLKVVEKSFRFSKTLPSEPDAERVGALRPCGEHCAPDRGEHADNCAEVAKRRASDEGNAVLSLDPSR